MLAEKIAALANTAEHQDKTFQRELVEQSQRIARESEEHFAKTGEYRGIFGLLSLDPDLDRTFSSDAIKNPFGLDRTRFPIGTAYFNPRQFVYFVAPPEPNGKWHCVITLIEDRVLEEFKNKPGEMLNKLSDSLEIEQKGFRKPDWLRIELEISDDFAAYLKVNHFRVFPFDFLKTLPRRAAAATQSNFSAIPIAPERFFQDIRRIIVSSVDWNAPISPLEFAKHILKHRNTVAAGLNKVFSTFRIKLANAGELLFSMRDILIDNATMVSIVQTPKGAKAVETERLMGVGVEDANELKQVQAALQEVRQIRTFFKRPVTYVTFRFRAVLDEASGAIRFVERPTLTLPPKERIKIQTNAGKREEIVLEEFSYRKKLQSILRELDMVTDSIEKIFPERLAKWLIRVKKP